MKKLLLAISFLTFSLSGYCDTLDYYHVYFNDSLIGKYNSISERPVLELSESDVQEDDMITVRYGTDHPCVECIYVLSVNIEVKEKTPEAETTENFGKLSIPLKDLFYFRQKYGIDSFYFNFHVRTTHTTPYRGTYLFELKFM